MDLIVRNAKLAQEPGLKDIGIENGRIAAIQSKLKEKALNEIDAEGGLTTPTLVNCHIHLDKCLTGERVRSRRPRTAQEAIEFAAQCKAEFTVEDMKKRAMRVVEDAVTHGTTIMRTFADVDTIGKLTAVKALLEVKKECDGLIDLQVVAFPQEGIARNPGADEYLWKAMELGADLVGGIPWLEWLEKDAQRHTELVFEIAKNHDVDIHMLIDNTDDAYSRTIEYYAANAIMEKYQGRVSASHVEAMASYNDSYASRIIGLIRRADMNVVSNPHISLMLAGRLDRQPIRRGITRVKELLDAGVNVASGQDDVDDPYYPFGKPDMLEVGFFMSHMLHLGLPHELEMVFDMLTVNGAKTLGIKDYGLREGCRGDLIVFNAFTLHEAFRTQAERRYVVKGGKIVAESKLTRSIIRP